MAFVSFVYLVLLCLPLLAHGSIMECPPLPSRPSPTNIADLHPNDVKVVMTLGDSITAGFGLMGRKGLIEEYRGQSWCIGADPNATTMYTILKDFVPNLVGGSLGHHAVEICVDPDCPDDQYEPTLDVFNAAQSGAQVPDLNPHELDYLIGQLNSNPNVDMKNDWKVMTILIGANDLCNACHQSQPWLEPDVFQVGVVQAIERIRQSIPRTFVNLVQMFNLSGVYFLGQQSLYCADVHKDFASECDCIFENNGTNSREVTDQLTVQVNARMMQIQEMYQAKNYTDFAVVVQPFARNTNVSSLPLDFVSTLDCFHPSQIAHEVMGIALWNAMITPAAYKKTVINVTDVPICPTADTLFYIN